MALHDVLEDLLAEPLQPTVHARTRAMHQAVVRELRASSRISARSRAQTRAILLLGMANPAVADIIANEIRILLQENHYHIEMPTQTLDLAPGFPP